MYPVEKNIHNEALISARLYLSKQRERERERKRGVSNIDKYRRKNCLFKWRDRSGNYFLLFVFLSLHKHLMCGDAPNLTEAYKWQNGAHRLCWPLRRHPFVSTRAPHSEVSTNPGLRGKWLLALYREGRLLSLPPLSSPLLRDA